AGEQEGRLVAERTGLADQVPVVTEPFTEWVVQDTFRGRRPAWEKAGVQFTDDVELHELRKLRLLNGSHTLMAYAGQVAGCERVDEAISHREVRALVESLWDEARSTLSLPPAELDAYTSALEERFRNPRLADFLIRIAADGSAKLPVRVLPVIAERGGPSQAPGSVAAVAAWTTWVTDRVRAGHEVADPHAQVAWRAGACPGGLGVIVPGARYGQVAHRRPGMDHPAQQLCRLPQRPVRSSGAPPPQLVQDVVLPSVRPVPLPVGAVPDAVVLDR